MTVPSAFLLGWAVFLAASVLLFVLMGVIAWAQHRREVPSRARRLAEAAEWAEHAAAVTDRVQQAADRTSSAQAELAVAEAERAAAWQELEQAEAAHAAAVERYREVSGRVEGPKLAGPDSVVAHAALAAYRRGDLSQEQLWRVWSWGAGGGSELAEPERDVQALRTALRIAHLRYQAAAHRERTALAELGVADVESRVLAEEVATAADHAGWHDSRDEQRSFQNQ
ncbi:hypothetical protein JQS43_07670 [Natronosporangium hydrolyticum]|uniref:Uncharacterized protein n=1 Tax=Natronosporangium hydrolyticum TaxID=2811111 RepID=A0A895YEE5_9ACTN|nr:hypothetical protein [Natronosporangium hydrolyticum]QSB16167.1 hypothetical protein JQS43_07670 [Natronosporangium hydrolyticum]